jgi:hypothetical protein
MSDFIWQLRGAIGETNAFLLPGRNNTINGCGYSISQRPDGKVALLFATLDALEEQLGRQRYLCGDVQTEADWRLFPSLVRLGAVCTSRTIEICGGSMTMAICQTSARALWTPASRRPASQALSAAPKGQPVGARGIVPVDPIVDHPAHDRGRCGGDLTVAGEIWARVYRVHSHGLLAWGWPRQTPHAEPCNAFRSRREHVAIAGARRRRGRRRRPAWLHFHCPGCSARSFTGRRYVALGCAGKLVTLLPLIIAGALLSTIVGAIGGLIYMRLSGVDRVSAFFATVPGGVVETLNVAPQYGGQLEPIMVAQTTRVALIVVFAPFLVISLTGGGTQNPLLAVPVAPWLPLLGVLAVSGLIAALISRTRAPNAWLMAPLFLAAIVGHLGWVEGRMPDL